jgi:gas vesicle protein
MGKKIKLEDYTMSEERGVAKGLFLGFLAGGIVGGVLALLYAPKSGKELRQDISNKKDEMLDDAGEYLDIAKHKAQDIINEGKKRSEELISDAKKKAGNLLDDANNILNVAKEKTSTSYETAKTKIADESAKVKDAIKAGVDAYKEERNKI